MADIKVTKLTTNTLSKPHRIAAHVSSSEAPIQYSIEGEVGTVDPNASAFITGVPHDFAIVDSFMFSPSSTFAATALAAVNNKSQLQGPLAIGANYVVGLLTLTLHADSPAGADALNGFFLKIETGANAGQVRKILDFATDVATLDSGFDNAMTSGTETYTILGSSLIDAVDPTGGDAVYNVRVIGRYL